MPDRIIISDSSAIIALIEFDVLYIFSEKTIPVLCILHSMNNWL